MSSESTPATNDTDPLAVFSKVIGFLALYARDLTAGVYRDEDLVNLELNDGIDTTVQWPFICQRGTIRHNVRPPVDIGAMVRTVQRCNLHSYGDGPKCKMHPVVDDGIIAAYMLGGPDAVSGMQAKWAYAPHVYQAWVGVLTHFGHMIIAHDRRLGDPNPNVLALAALDTVHIPEDQQVDTKFGRLEEFSVIVRPGDPIRQKRRRKKGK